MKEGILGILVFLLFLIVLIFVFLGGEKVKSPLPNQPDIKVMFGNEKTEVKTK